MGVLENILATLQSIDSKLSTSNAPVVTEVAAAVSAALPVVSTLPAIGTAPAAPSVDTATEVDSKGFPWDERIHAGTKSKIKDLSWTYKRGVSAELTKQVEDEYRALGFGSLEPEVPVVAALPAGPATGLPALPGLPAGIPPIPAAQKPVSVEMPVVVEGQEIDDNLMIQIAAATYAQHPVEFIDGIFGLLQMAADSAAVDVDPQYRYTFYSIATNVDLQKHYGLVG